MEYVTVGSLVECPECGGNKTSVAFVVGRPPVMLCGECRRAWEVLMSIGREVDLALGSPNPESN